MLNEMLGHLERQPRNKDRRVAWLKFVEPLLHGIGLVLVAHFSRIFPLFFKWLHADDDETVLLVRVHALPLPMIINSFGLDIAISVQLYFMQINICSIDIP